MTRTRHPLDGVRSDGWFDRVLAGVPALVRLSAGVGEALVALSLVAGFRITAATVDRATANVSELQWVREGAEGAGPADRGTPEMLRDAVLLALHDEPPGRLPAGKVDDDALRELVGVRTILLAPLFGVELRAVLVGDGPTLLALGTDQGEVEVPLEEVQRFLRGRVVEVLRAPRGRGAAVDLAQLDGVREACEAGRHDEVISVMTPQFGALVAFLRTADGAALGPESRAVVARALVALARSLAVLDRSEEGGDALRLAAQYAHDGPAAAEVYLAIAEGLVMKGRHAEAIGPLRRAVVLDPSLRGVARGTLATCYLATNRAVGALAVLEEMRAAGDDVTALEAGVTASLGPAAQAWRWHVEGRRPVVVALDAAVSADG